MLHKIARAWHLRTGTKVFEQDGVKVRCGPDDLPRAVRSLLFQGTYEAAERELLPGALRPGDRVLEVGTGIGLVSLVCTSIVGEGNVLSYEANPAMAAVIRANYVLNGWTPDLREKAVTVDGTPITFFQSGNVLSSSLYDRGTDAAAIEVESDAIEAVVSAHRPAVIVMDVEGAEVDLLPAADLSTVRAIVVELHPHIVGEGRTNALMALMEERGFRLARTVHKNALFTREAA